MAKTKKPDDLLDTHARIARRVLWLETHTEGEKSEKREPVTHVHDIVEHLFRGSMQAHTGAAPFGHLAAHLWEMEHDVSVANDWEFHRKMRLMRERVGANKPLVDAIGDTEMFGTNGRFTTGTDVQRGWHYDSLHGPVRGSTEITLPAPMHIMVITRGGIWQPYMLPGDPGRYSSHFSFSYTITAGETKFHEPIEEKHYEWQDGPNTELYGLTTPPEESSSEQIVNAAYQSCDSAVNVAFFESTYGRGGGIRAYSERWKRINEEVAKEPGETRYTEYDLTPASKPVEGMYAGGSGFVPADTSRTGSLPDDILIWVDSQYLGPISCYPEREVASGYLERTKDRVFVDKGEEDADKCGVHGGIWYEAFEPNAYVPVTEWDGYGKYVWFPADFLQSPGPPVDYDVEHLASVDYLGTDGTLPPNQSALCTHGEGRFAGAIDDPERPYRTFEEAVAIFEEIKSGPLFTPLMDFWNKHVADFHRNGSALSHGWERESSIGAYEMGGGNDPTGLVEYLKRYGYCHLRGRLAWGRAVVGGLEAGSAWSSTELPEPALEPESFIGTAIFIDQMCPSNIGLVRVRFTWDSVLEMRFPDLPDLGAGSASNLLWVDLDGISYPCEES